MRKTEFKNGEIYHVYNRGVEKRDIFSDAYDIARFFESMQAFNALEPIGSLYQNSFRNKLSGETAKSVKVEKLVDFIAYCLNPNHYHFILRQVTDGGISEFMKRLAGGYTWHFNHKYKRDGALFQGVFKSVHVASDGQLLHLSAYVNLNNRVHQLKNVDVRFGKIWSSWEEYIVQRKEQNLCETDFILNQFRNKGEYKRFAQNALDGIVERKKLYKEVESILLEK